MKEDTDVYQKDVKIFCDATQFPSLWFCGTHKKPHGARGLSNHHHNRFDPKLGHGICTIHRIPCDYVEFISMLDKT